MKGKDRIQTHGHREIREDRMTQTWVQCPNGKKAIGFITKHKMWSPRRERV